MTQKELKKFLKDNKISLVKVMKAIGFRKYDEDCEDNWIKDSYRKGNCNICIEHNLEDL